MSANETTAEKTIAIQSRADARREQLLRELASDMADLVASGDMTSDEANVWIAAKADQWSHGVHG